MSSQRVAIIVPTLNAVRLWDRWVAGMRMQTFVPDVVLVVDSSSTDGTAERAQAEATGTRIERKDFNHGGRGNSDRSLGHRYRSLPDPRCHAGSPDDQEYRGFFRRERCGCG
jgi:glycosyltransferase involved in cell wall biosynthesis